MTITREKVIGFFEDRCSAAEAEAIHAYLQEHPQWVAAHFPEEEWREFVLDPAADQRGTGLSGPAADQPGARIWNGVAAQTGVGVRGKRGMLRALRRRGTVRTMRLRYAGVAAAVVMMIGAGTFFASRPGTRAHETAIVLREEPISDSIFLNNRTPRVTRDTLADGSVLELLPGSSVALGHAFGGKKRDVVLKGEALFRVAHIPGRPFTVYAAGLATTALGTVFRVSAYEGHGMPTVRLLEGTVIVKCIAHPQLSALLSPGERCVFDVAGNTFRTTKPLQALTSTAPDLSNMDEGSYEESTDALVFKNMALAKVLHILSLTYTIPILYRNKELDKRKFTGNIDKRKPLDTALGTLGELNDIVVERRDDGSFRVHLQQETPAASRPKGDH